MVVITGVSGLVGGNLAPRARAHHAWYRANYPEYPKESKALIPGIW